jgi:hypothetical protein
LPGIAGMNIIAILNSLNTLLQKALTFCSKILLHLAAKIWNLAIKVGKGLLFIFLIIKFYRGDMSEILGFVLVIKSGEDLFISILRPKVGVFEMFVVYYKASFEKR